MFKLISEKKLRQQLRDAHQAGFTLGYQLTQSHQTGEGFFVGVAQTNTSKLEQELARILEDSQF